jgi:hypothetical protein
MGWARGGAMRNLYKILIRNTEGNRLLGRPWHAWEDNIKTDLREIVLGVWICLRWLMMEAGDGIL